MDIDEFIEQDILVFLDRELDKPQETEKSQTGMQTTAFLTRDYEKEFFAALDNDSVTKAKRVLHDLKQKFDEFPNGTPEKQQLKVLLTDLYEKFKDHLDTEHTFEKMEEELDSVHQPQKERPKEDKQEDLVKHANSMLDKVETAVERGNVKDAMHEYRLARKDVLEMEKVPAQLAMRFSGVFKKIQDAAKKPPEKKVEPPKHVEKPVPPPQHHVEKTHPKKPVPLPQHHVESPKPVPHKHEKKNIPPPTPAPVKVHKLKKTGPSEQDKKLLVQLEEQKRVLEKQLHAGEVKAAILTYKQMAELTRSLDDTKLATKTATKLKEVFAIIGQLKSHAQQKNIEKNVILQLEREKHALDKQLQNNDIKAAVETYRRMKTIVQHLTNKHLAERMAKKLVRIFEIIQKLRAHSDDRSLIRTVP